ncbi:MAG: phospholipase D-like domain-containing protein [Novosphingobium sp.]|nr:phospholipase D-like domain-containing protein [Novosphingobium sp.]
MIQRFSSLRQRLDHVFLANRLKGARSYKRIAGYFRSSILELVGEQIEDIEDVRIVCNSELDPHDVMVSKAAREVALKERWNQEPIDTEAFFHRERYRRLYKLLSSGRVQIKVVPKNRVFLHGKAGVITMADGRRTSFLGSINESRAAFAENYEILWEDPSEEGCRWVDEEFEALWAEGHDLPDAILTEVKRIAERVEVTFGELPPKDIPAATMVESPIYRGGEQLQPWQRSFVATFLQHREIYGKARLLIADEVGLGKTLSMATAALVSSLLGDGPVLILCPATLTLQWQAELKDRLGIPSGVWVSNQKCWLDAEGRTIMTRGPEDIGRCPFQVAIVSTGLIVHQSTEASVLKRIRVGTLILDESHKARRRGQLGVDEPEPNNLLAFMMEMANSARHVLLGTATPIQTAVRELWDLLMILNQSADFVMGRDHASIWRFWQRTHPLITGQEYVPDEVVAWDLLRSPLPAKMTPMMDDVCRQLVLSIRSDLNMADTQFHASDAPTALTPFARADLQSVVKTNFFQRNNPFVRHVVLRRRKTLEEAGLLEKIAVDVHPDPEAPPGTYPGVTFVGRGLMTNRPFELAYEAAEAFIDVLSKRTKGAKLLRSVFLQRICSSFQSGRLTVERMLERRVDTSDDNPQMELAELGALQTLTDEEVGYLEAIRDELARAEAVDPKLNAVRWFLSQHRSSGQTWSELGCIIFSQYYDTAHWVATELAKDFPDKVVAVYAGAGKSGLFRDGEFIGVERDRIKKLVKTREVQLVVATDAACEGLNLQTLGTLVNIDLPWNPSRLEQRLGRIKRFGQARDTVDMLNLTYHATRDEDVYNTISARMKDRFDIFGGLPDCIDDEWIEDIQEFEDMAQTHLHLRGQISNIFEETWGSTVSSDQNRWEECTKVLSRTDIQKVMGTPWK